VNYLKWRLKPFNKVGQIDLKNGATESIQRCEVYQDRLYT